MSQVTLRAEIALLPLCEAPVQSWSDGEGRTGEQLAPNESRNSKVQRYQQELSAARSGDAKPPAYSTASLAGGAEDTRAALMGPAEPFVRATSF